MRSVATIVCATTLSLLMAACASAAPPAEDMSSPPLRCEFQQGAWCIAEGAYVVTRSLSSDRVHDRTWSLRGRFRQESELLINEVNGCKSGYADGLTLLNYESSVEMQGARRDRMKVRLKSDGTCDLEFLIPSFDGDPMEWAFSTGLTLIRACKDAECTSLPLADLKSQVEGKFKDPSKAN